MKKEGSFLLLVLVPFTGPLNFDNRKLDLEKPATKLSQKMISIIGTLSIKVKLNIKKLRKQHWTE